MTSETRTLIEPKDISSIEFECPKCSTKILYPLDRSYDRLADKCPNCFEPWFDDENRRISEESTPDLVLKTLESLRNISTTPKIKAHVKLQIAAD